jgi:cephalosporin hydroxylase
MRLSVDTTARSLTVSDNGEARALDLYGKEAFEFISDLWMKLSWQQKYSYTFTWLGRPIIQHPEDMVRMQEVVYTLKPDVIVETGVAHGGSLIFNASLLHNIGKGRVVGVDIEIRPHNRAAIEAHSLAPMITLIEGDSAAPEVVSQVRALIRPDDTVLIFLDSDHSRRHVLAELEAYHNLVSVGSYIVATDGIMREVHDVPRGKPAWLTDNPAAAAQDFLATHKDFALSPPQWSFNESELDKVITGHPDAWLQRIC